MPFLGEYLLSFAWAVPFPILAQASLSDLGNQSPEGGGSLVTPKDTVENNLHCLIKALDFPLEWEPEFFSFYWWGNGGTERQGNLPELTELGS